MNFKKIEILTYSVGFIFIKSSLHRSLLLDMIFKIDIEIFNQITRKLANWFLIHRKLLSNAAVMISRQYDEMSGISKHVITVNMYLKQK